MLMYAYHSHNPFYLLFPIIITMSTWLYTYILAPYTYFSISNHIHCIYACNFIPLPKLNMTVEKSKYCSLIGQFLTQKHYTTDKANISKYFAVVHYLLINIINYNSLIFQWFASCFDNVRQYQFILNMFSWLTSVTFCTFVFICAFIKSHILKTSLEKGYY